MFLCAGYAQAEYAGLQVHARAFGHSDAERSGADGDVDVTALSFAALPRVARQIRAAGLRGELWGELRAHRGGAQVDEGE